MNTSKENSSNASKPMLSDDFITLDQLSIYLPFFVNYIDGRRTIYELNVSNISCFDYQFSKLILRPMSDFYNQINVRDGLIIPNDFLMEKFGDTSCITYNMLVGSYTKWEFVKKLAEWHFDIFGLIEKGLAISIHDVKQVIA